MYAIFKLGKDMKILLIEDDKRIAEPVAEDLKHQHYIVDIAYNGIEGWQYTQTTQYELILLNVTLPRLDGISLCKRLRAAKYNTLILMLSSRNTIADKVMGLDAGADDYLVKPFELEELTARIRALSRRSPEIRQPILVYGDLRLDPSSCNVTYQNKPLSLTPKEYMLLECFLINQNHVLTRSRLVEKLWNYDALAGKETIKTHITNLRKKLKAAGNLENLIETVYGIGYRLGNG